MVLFQVLTFDPGSLKNCKNSKWPLSEKFQESIRSCLFLISIFYASFISVSCYSGVTLSLNNLVNSFHHRWCVSGTPLGKSLDDLYGLFVFLKVSNYLWLSLNDQTFYNFNVKLFIPNKTFKTKKLYDCDYD